VTARIFHDDVTGYAARAPVGVLHEVVDLDDAWMLDLGEEAPLGKRCGHGVGVSAVEHALERHPPAYHVPVPRQVDPTETTVGQAAKHLVLTGDQISRRQFRYEGVPAILAEALGKSGPAIGAAPDGLLTPAAESLVLRHQGVGQDRVGRIAARYRLKLY